MQLALHVPEQEPVHIALGAVAWQVPLHVPMQLPCASMPLPVPPAFAAQVPSPGTACTTAGSTMPSPTKRATASFAGSR